MVCCWLLHWVDSNSYQCILSMNQWKALVISSIVSTLSTESNNTQVSKIVSSTLTYGHCSHRLLEVRSLRRRNQISRDGGKNNSVRVMGEAFKAIHLYIPSIWPSRHLNIDHLSVLLIHSTHSFSHTHILLYPYLSRNSIPFCYSLSHN